MRTLSFILAALASLSFSSVAYAGSSFGHSNTIGAPDIFSSVYVTATPSTITEGESTYIQWGGIFATDCTTDFAYTPSAPVPYAVGPSGYTTESPTQDKTYRVWCTGTIPNSQGQTALSASVTVTVLPPADNGLTVSCEASPDPASVGDNVIWTANASGGEGVPGDPSSGTWQETGESYTKVCSAGRNIQQPSCDGGMIAGESCSTVGATCKDHAYNFPNGCDSPAGDESAGPTIYSTVTTYTCEASGSGDGASGPSYSYSWSGTDGLSGSGPTAVKSYATTGTKSATVTVTSGSREGSAQCSVEVAAAPSECSDLEDNDNDSLTDAEDPGCQGGDSDGSESSSPSLQCDVTTDTLTAGDEATYTATITGGGGPYTYTWTPIGGQECTGTGASRTCTFPNPGVYQMSLVADGTANLSCTFDNVDASQMCGLDSFAIEASAERVKKGSTVDVTWSAPADCSCQASGPGGLSSSQSVGAFNDVVISGQSKFTLTCSGRSESVTVNPVGLFFEF